LLSRTLWTQRRCHSPQCRRFRLLRLRALRPSVQSTSPTAVASRPSPTVSIRTQPARCRRAAVGSGTHNITQPHEDVRGAPTSHNRLPRNRAAFRIKISARQAVCPYREPHRPKLPVWTDPAPTPGTTRHRQRRPVGNDRFRPRLQVGTEARRTTYTGRVHARTARGGPTWGWEGVDGRDDLAMRAPAPAPPAPAQGEMDRFRAARWRLEGEMGVCCGHG
jgi:hypothetical protein